MAQVHQTIDARHYQADEVLRDGSIVQIRAIRPDDQERLLEHFAGLGARSRYLRFFGVKRALTGDDLIRFSELDFEQQVGLAAAIQQNGERFIGIGQYIRTELLSHADIAIAVSDEYQGIGVGRLLIRHLARIAHANGVTQLEADVMGDNRRMLAILHNSGCIIYQANEAGVVHLVLDCPMLVIQLRGPSMRTVLQDKVIADLRVKDTANHRSETAPLQIELGQALGRIQTSADIRAKATCTRNCGMALSDCRQSSSVITTFSDEKTGLKPGTTDLSGLGAARVSCTD